MSLLLVVKYKLPWLPECFQLHWEIPSRGITLCWEQLRSLTNLSSTLKSLIHSLTCISQIFVRYLPKWSQQVRTVLVQYLLLRIHILVYSCTGCGISKIYLCLEDNRPSISCVSLNFETKDACLHKQPLSSVCERYDFWKTKVWRQTSWRWIDLCLMLKSWRWTIL